jgi:hypothetical protein
MLVRRIVLVDQEGFGKLNRMRPSALRSLGGW